MKFAFAVLSVFIVTFGITTFPSLAVNQVLTLDGSGDYVEARHSASLNITKAITVEAWVFHKTMGANPGQAWASKYLGPVSWDIHSNGFFVSRNGNENNMLEFSIPQEEWVHVACVYDGLQQRVYVNGALSAERDWPGSLAPTGSPVQIGTHHNQYWTGMLDEVHIWNVARTEGEIQSAMNAPLTGNEEGLAAYWNFDDGTADDLSPYGNDGTFHGDAARASRPK